MAKPAVEFVADGTKLLLVYRPRGDAVWVHEDFAKSEPLDIKGTYHLTKADLAQRRRARAPDDDEMFEVTFVVASAKGDYFVFKPEIVEVDVPVLVARDVTPTWKWFSAEERVSVLRLLADLRPSRGSVPATRPTAGERPLRPPAGGQKFAGQSEFEVVVDGQRRVVAEALLEVDRHSPGQRGGTLRDGGLHAGHSTGRWLLAGARSARRTSSKPAPPIPSGMALL